MRAWVGVVLAACVVAAGCGSTSTNTVTEKIVEKAATTAAAVPTEPTASSTRATSHAVPSFTGQRLDVAESNAEEAGIHFKVIGGGTFGVVVPSHWTVCEQEPTSGRKAPSVKLIVAKSC